MTGGGIDSAPAPVEGTMGGMEPRDMMDAVVTGLAERTGRDLPAWVALVGATDLDPLDQRAVRAWLKAEHGVPQNSQWAIADAVAREAGWTSPTLEEATAALYSGANADLRPLHDAVVEMTHSLGEDIEAQVRSSYIPLVRRTQFLALAPGPRHTLRVGLRFKGAVPDDDRLTPAKGFAQATHVVLVAADVLDADLISLEPLIATAYDQNG